MRKCRTRRPMTWWQRLEARLVERGMSMAELSRRSGVAYDNIAKYLHGEVDNPRGESLARIAEAVGLTEAELRYGALERAPGADRGHAVLSVTAAVEAIGRGEIVVVTDDDD